MDTTIRSNSLLRRLRRLSLGEQIEEAFSFLDQFYRENEVSDASLAARKREVAFDLLRFRYYEHTPEELAYGARLAWRNHSRCIGRLLWRSLEVVDCRSVVESDAMAGRIIDHMRAALGDGRVRSIISVFAPIKRNALPHYVESAQIVQYAGYIDPGDPRIVVGDRQQVEYTRIAISLGWKPKRPPGRFDVLPFCIREAAGKRRLYDVDPSVIKEISIEHPHYASIGQIGLKWYAVPLVSNMILTIGGIDFPCAPFNGFYMGTEIASRDFADENRYDLLPVIAEAIGIDHKSTSSIFWKDRALTEINFAVLHSFRAAGVSIVDHHTASQQYMDFVRHEQAEGRTPSGDWSWIVPPQASSSCPVFHLPMRDLNAVPNFYHSRATDGAMLKPSYVDEPRGKTRQRWDRLRFQFRDWRREWDR